MKVLCHQLILVAVLITGQTDAVSEITRRDEEQVPLSGQMKAYPKSSLNLNTEAQLSAETEKASVGKVLNLKAPNGFSFDDSNEAGESFETEANVVTENDGRDQVNGANTLDEHNFLPPPRGNDYKNELMTTAHASTSADFETGDKTKKGAIVKNDAVNQSELQAQFRQEAQYGAESQAETVIPENQETFKNLPPAQEMMQLPYGTSPLARPPVNKSDVKNTLKANPIIGASSEPLNKPGRETGSWYARLPNKVPYGLSKPIYTYGSPFVVTTPPADRATNPSIAYTDPVNKRVPFHQVSKTGIKKYKTMANGYEATRIPNWVPHQKGNPTKSLAANEVAGSKHINWNPYKPTYKPIIDDTLIQAIDEEKKLQVQTRAETVADLAAEENGNKNPNLIPYQKKNLKKPIVPIDILQNGYNNNENWYPYTKPAEGDTLVQAEGKIQGNGDQSPNLIQYQKENPNTPLVPNVFQNGYNTNKDWSPYTKPTEGETLVQWEKEIQSNGEGEANLATLGNGNRNPILLQYQKENANKPLVPISIYQNVYNNNNWNPYTKPAEGETLVQADGKNHYNEKTVTDLAAQENGDQSPELIPNQVENINKPLVPINDFQNGYNNNKNWNPYTKPTVGETLVQMEEEIQSNGKVEANLAVQENGNRNPNLLQYQKEYPNKPLVPINIIQSGYNNNNWNPYTKPVEGETLVQAEGENHYTEKTVADLAAQESDDRSPRLISNQKENINNQINGFQNGYNNNNNWDPYTKPTEGETLVQMEEEIQNNGKAETNIAAPENDKRDIVSLNGYNNNKNWNPYTKPAEGETLIQAEGEIQSSQLNSGMQYKPSVQANIVAQSNGGFHYSEENKITSAAEVAAKAPANIASSYSGGLAATQMNGAQESGSSIYGNTNKYNNVYSNGPGNENSHLQNGAQFGAVKGVEPPGQAYPVIDARFGQTTHPVRRPLSAYGYKQPNGWNHW